VDIYDLLVYKVKRPIHITLNRCFLKIMDFLFWGRRIDGKGHGERVKNVLFLGDVFNGCSLSGCRLKVRGAAVRLELSPVIKVAGIVPPRPRRRRHLDVDTQTKIDNKVMTEHLRNTQPILRSTALVSSLLPHFKSRYKKYLK